MIHDATTPTDARAVSTTLGYVLTLGISMLLVTGLVVAGGTYVADQREQVIRTELRVIGGQISSDIAAIDRLARTWGTDRVAVTRQLPDKVAGVTYTIEVVATDPHLVLTTSEPDVTVTVDLANTTAIAAGTAGGGTVEIVYDGTAVEVRDG